jgi:hypothetical protein
VGQAAERLGVLAEALDIVDRTGERFWEAELSAERAADAATV